MGHGAVDRRDGFAFVEVCHGGLCMCVYVFFAWWFDWQWWIGMWVFASLSFFFLLTDLGFMIVFFHLTNLGFVIVFFLFTDLGFVVL